jgi:hypothetical protein
VYEPDASAARLAFELRAGAYNADTLIAFLTFLHELEADRSLLLLWDGLPAHVADARWTGSRTSPGHQSGDARVHQRQLHIDICRSSGASDAPAIAEQSLSRIKLTLLRNLALADCRSAHNHLQDASSMGACLIWSSPASSSSAVKCLVVIVITPPSWVSANHSWSGSSAVTYARRH